MYYQNVKKMKIKDYLKLYKKYNIYYHMDELEFAFETACETGNLKLAKDLLYKYPNINISSNNEYSFSYACKNNHLQ